MNKYLKCPACQLVGMLWSKVGEKVIMLAVDGRRGRSCDFKSGGQEKPLWSKAHGCSELGS